MLYLRDLSYHPTAVSQPILKNINLDMAPQQLGVIVGPSGSGKSTLLEILAGLAEPTSGGMFWRDQELNYLHMQQICGLVFQFPERHFCGAQFWKNCAWAIQSWDPIGFAAPSRK